MYIMDIVKVISLKKKYVSGKIEVNAINGIDLNIKRESFWLLQDLPEVGSRRY